MDGAELAAAAQGAARPARPGAAGRREGRLPVVNFSAGGLATPADAALMMQLGAEGVFVGLGHLQVRGSARAGAGDRPRDDALRGPRGDRRGLARRSARRCPASTSRSSTRAACSSIVAGSVGRRRPRSGRGPASACLRSRATSRPTPRRSSGSAADAVEVRRPRDLDGLDGLVIPGGESTTIDQGSQPAASSSRYATSRGAGGRYSARAPA